MSRLTRCATPRQSKPPLPRRPVLSMIFAVAVVLVFALAQLHLQFSLNDLKLETRRLQTRKLDLRSDINRLRGEVESRKQGERLIEYARNEMGMEEYSLADAERITIDPQVQALYDRAKDDPLEIEADRSSERILAEKLADRFSLTREALAVASTP